MRKDAHPRGAAAVIAPPQYPYATQAQGFAAPLSLTFTLAPPSCFYPRHANAIVWLKCMVYLCKLAPVKAKLGGEGEVLGEMRTVFWWLFPVHPKEAGRKQANRFVCGTLWFVQVHLLHHLRPRARLLRHDVMITRPPGHPVTIQ